MLKYGLLLLHSSCHCLYLEGWDKAAGPYSNSFLLTYRSVFTYACKEELCGANRHQHLFFVININGCDSGCVESLFKGLLHAVLACLLTISLLQSDLKSWNGWFFQRQLQIKQLSPTYAPITQHNNLEKKKLSLLTQGKKYSWY